MLKKPFFLQILLTFLLVQIPLTVNIAYASQKRLSTDMRETSAMTVSQIKIANVTANAHLQRARLIEAGRSSAENTRYSEDQTKNPDNTEVKDWFEKDPSDSRKTPPVSDGEGDAEDRHQPCAEGPVVNIGGPIIVVDEAGPVVSLDPGSSVGIGNSDNLIAQPKNDKRTTFTFWPASTFSKHGDSKALGTLIDTFSDMVNSVNVAKENFLSATTTYRSNPLTQAEKEAIRYDAGSVIPAIDINTLSGLSNFSIENNLTIQNTVNSGKASSFRPKAENLNTYSHVNDAAKALKIDKLEIANFDNSPNLYRLARLAYEKELNRINEVFSEAMEKFQILIGEPIISEDSKGIQMVISVS